MILVTGSKGFIGKSLLAKLKCLRMETAGIDLEDGNISDPGTLSNQRYCNVKHVFHLAGKTFIPESWRDPYLFYEVNVIGTQNVLDLCRRVGARITFVSAYVYGVPEKQPISEIDEVKPNNPYAHSKYLAEQLCSFYEKEFGIPVCIVRPFNIYGVGQDKRFLIPSIIDQALGSSEIVLENLTCKRDHLYIDDFVEALIRTLDVTSRFSIYNVGSGHSLSVSDVVTTIQQALGMNKPVIVRNDERYNEIRDTVADITKAERELRWKPVFSFKEGIGRVVAKFQEDVTVSI